MDLPLKTTITAVDNGQLVFIIKYIIKYMILQ